MSSACIFDLYGTLLDFPRDSRPFLKIARRHPDASVRSSLETSLTTHNPTLAAFASRIGLASQNDLTALNAALDEDIAAIEPFQDAEVILRELKQRGIPTALISNLATPYKQPFFTHHLAPYFDVVVFSCDCGMLKPDSRIYDAALKQLGANPDETIMVGDSFRSDVDGPSKLGIRGIHLVRSGGRSKASHVISSLDGLWNEFSKIADG